MKKSVIARESLLNFDTSLATSGWRTTLPLRAAHTPFEHPESDEAQL